MEFSIDKLAKDVAEKALDEITYEGKTIREWVEIIVKQQPCEDCISRQATIDAIYKKHIGGKDAIENAPINDLYACGLNEVVDAIVNMPSVTPQQTRWIPVTERLPNDHEYIKNNGLFNVSDGNRSYFGWFDIYDTKRFVKPTIAGFRVDNAVIAWMPLPEDYKEAEE